MQGRVVKTAVFGVVVLCAECANWNNLSGADHIALEGLLQSNMVCSVCDAVIDGEEEEPKPESFTVTVQVVIYASDDIQTAQDAQDLVEQELCHFESVEVQDILEHF